MKKNILSMFAIVLFAIGSATFTGCGGGGEHSHDENTHAHEGDEGAHEHAEGEEVHAAVYQCPMKCEDDKTYDKSGKCPVCKMDLEQIKHDEHEDEHSDHDGHNH